MLRTASVIVIALMLAGCAGEQLSLGETKPATPAAPKVEMGGRWMLATPNAPVCGMRFNGASGAREGTIAPEGGCPGNFFTSRHWAFENNELVIKDHNSEPLANLTFDNGKFEGKAATGMQVTLSH